MEIGRVNFKKIYILIFGSDFNKSERSYWIFEDLEMSTKVIKFEVRGFKFVIDSITF